MGRQITVREVTEMYGLSERTIRRYLSEGRLSAKKCGPRLLRLDAEQVEQALMGDPASPERA